MALVKKKDVYYAVIKINGKQVWFRCGTNRREAQRRHDELVVDAARGKVQAPSRTTFSEYADEWLVKYGDVRLKRSTRLEYGIYIERHLKPFFGEMRLAAITTQTVQSYISNRITEAGLSPKSIRNHLVVLKRMMAIAVDWQLISSNPASKAVLPRIPQKEIEFLTPADIRRLLDSTPEGAARLLLATACLTGPRKGEILAMAHGSWDLVNRTITVKRTLYAGQFQTPKSVRSLRVLPMPDYLADMYAALFPDGSDPESLIFCQPDGSPLANGTPNRILDRALTKAGLSHVTFHALRHSFISAAIASRVPIKVIQALAGHASIQMTLDRYGHLLPESRGDAARAVENAIFGDEEDHQ